MVTVILTYDAQDRSGEVGEGCLAIPCVEDERAEKIWREVNRFAGKDAEKPADLQIIRQAARVIDAAEKLRGRKYVRASLKDVEIRYTNE